MRATPIVRQGRTLAVITHDASETGAIALERAFGAAARMAVENERLRVELLAQIEDLQASRTRIVATGDAERSRLEHDLHDGAQLRLLAVLSEIAAAQYRAVRRNQPALAMRLTDMSGEAQGLVDELRRIAHGIYPAILSATGLRAALLSLADSAALPVELSGVPEQRVAPEAERTAYAFVAAAVEEGARSGSEVVAVAMTVTDDTLEIAIDGAGSGPFTHLADRVGAARGDLSLYGSTLRARIPCA